MIENIGAGEGNRTLVFSLEGCCSTIELHPHRIRAWSFRKTGTHPHHVRGRPFPDHARADDLTRQPRRVQPPSSPRFAGPLPQRRVGPYIRAPINNERR